MLEHLGEKTRLILRGLHLSREVETFQQKRTMMRQRSVGATRPLRLPSAPLREAEMQHPDDAVQR